MQPIARTISIMEYLGWCSFSCIILVSAIFIVRTRIIRKRSLAFAPTWGCGYTGDTKKMQYTASSFVRSYRKLIEPLLSIHINKKEADGIFPTGAAHTTHPHDRIEEWVIDTPLKKIHSFFDKFRFLQNGNLQLYVLYGFLFITFIIGVPFFYGVLHVFFEFLNEL